MGREIRGFFGGIILRGEGHSKALTGRISLFRSEIPVETTIGCNKASLLKTGITKSVRIADDFYLSSGLWWMEPGFSQFGFDLIAMMQGSYEVGRVSSFYGMGSSDMEPIKA